MPTSSPAAACSTCSPAPVRSGWRRCRAAPPFALFVEDSAAGRALVRQNVETLGLTGRTKIFRRDATRLGPLGPLAPFDLVFADPPYGKGLAERALAGAAADGWLAPGALCVVEESAAADFRPPPGFALVESRAYGDTRLFLLAAA